MSKEWWYVENGDRRGPVSESDLKNMLTSGDLNTDSFIWTKGFENWIKLGETPELSGLLEGGTEMDIPDRIPAPRPEFDLNSIGPSERVFYIKTGMDRNKNDSGSEYGPFSQDQLKRLFSENRINDKTYIFTNGMDNWTLLADFDLFENLSGGKTPSVNEDERRINMRKPFVASMYFHDQSELYEGVCRDISVGGMQVLVSNFPGKINDEVTMNVHPENTEYSFVATGKIVRLLDGNSGFSLRFSGINEDATSAINNYLQNN